MNLANKYFQMEYVGGEMKAFRLLNEGFLILLLELHA